MNQFGSSLNDEFGTFQIPKPCRYKVDDNLDDSWNYLLVSMDDAYHVALVNKTTTPCNVFFAFFTYLGSFVF